MVNHYNIYVENKSNKSFSINNLNVSNSGVLESDPLINMFSLENITSIIISLHVLQQLNSSHSNSKTVYNFLTSNKIYFAEKLKLTFKCINMLDERVDSNIKEDDESIQTFRKSDRGRLRKKVNIKFSKTKTSRKY